MPVKKKGGKINTAPSGISFHHEPRGFQENEMPCREDGCKGIIVEAGPQTKTQANRSDAVVYICTHCDWISPDGFEHEPTKRSTHHVVTEVVKKQKQRPVKKAEVEMFRAEFRKRMTRLVKEREKIKKPSNKLTDAERAHLHKFSFTSKMICADLGLTSIKGV